MPAPSSKEPEERNFVVDFGASMHMLSKNELSSDEMETLRRSRNTTTAVTAIGEVQTSEEVQVFDHDPELFVTVQTLDDTPAVLLLGELFEERGCACEWASGRKPHLTKKVKRILCKSENVVPFVVPGLSSSSSAESSSTSFPQDSSSTSPSPAKLRSDDPSYQASGDRRDPTKIRNINKQKGNDQATRSRLCDLPEWLAEFTNNLKDAEVPAPANTSRESDSERPTKVATRKHRIETFFPKDQNYDENLRTKITKALCRRRIGEALPRAEKLGDLITADHNVLNEEGESRDNHQYAAAVQDLATQRIQSYPCKTKTSQETEKSLRKFLEPSHKPLMIIQTIHRTLANLVKTIMESSNFDISSIRDKWHR